ncbi:MAG: NTP transferase domain-containing protein [Alphaproteobacteria bacterium]|nr:NTP transferase domain-containing protein [Alphaproteobacteria bacterium]MBV9152223.1 NTP transferase domain-containing protein [Alphaproteobacteria bacterium]
MAVSVTEVPVFILCGGLGTRLKEMTEFRPKPMIPLGPEPILVHIMRHYSRFGFNRFVLCMGYKSEIIREYFLNFYAMHSEVTIDLKTNTLDVHSVDHSCDWKVTLADTGELTMTGARVARAAARYLGSAEHFAVTYGDGLTNADLAAEFDFHLSRGKTGTVLGINPPSRFGEFLMDGAELKEFVEKPELHSAWINGGYFFFRRDFVKYVSTEESCVLEREPLSTLAREAQLAVYQHRDFWACMDTQRDHEYLTKLWESGQAPWVGPAHCT